MKEISEALKNKSLTKVAQKIAAFILDNMEEACFMTSTEIAAQVNASEASVIRFTRALGFSGYMDFQKSLRKSYSEKVASISNNITVPAERLLKSVEKSDSTDVMEMHLHNCIHDLNSVVQKNTSAAFIEAADLIMRSHRKYIVSSRANTGVGSYMYLLLKHMLDDVYSTNHPALSVIDILSDAEKEDCIIAFSFPRYSELDLSALEMVVERGTSIVVFTDKPSSPLAQHASSVILADVDTNVFFNSYVGVQFAMETLCVVLSQKLGPTNEEKLKRIDKYLGRHGLF